jgi:hypothetical protein
MHFCISYDQRLFAAEKISRLVGMTAKDDGIVSQAQFSVGVEEIKFSELRAIEERFYQCRTLLQERYTLSSAKTALYPLIERQTVDRIYNKNHEKPFDKITMKRLIYHFDELDNLVYRRLVEKMSMNASEIKTLIDDYSGKYFSYFRYSSDARGFKQYNNGGGKIYIFNRKTTAFFTHRSHNASTEKHEHEGMVFKSGDHLFFLSTGTKSLRLSAVHIPRDAKNEPYYGIILSSLADVPNTPFAARFIMVDEGNIDLIKELTNDPSSGHSQKGEDNFKKRMKSDDTQFMLAF